ncbi:Indolepyruvate oxidoreductase subunit IorA [uncultured Gammaproteobacteria bacterium]
MNMAITGKTGSRSLMSGNEAIARAVWEAGTKVATAYPGTPSTEILETLAFYPELHAEWSVNEKVALEVAFGASMTGARAFTAMKHVGMNVASDPLMTITLTGVKGGLVIAVADDVGMSSSQNEQDSRFWGRFAHLPILEPIDSQEAYDFTKFGFELSEKFETPVILRLTTRVCHVKSVVTTGQREEREAPGFKLEPSRWVMVPAYAKKRLGLMLEREKALAAYSETSDLNTVEVGSDSRVGFVVSGPAYLHLREVFPSAPVLRLGLSCPLPVEKIRAFAASVDKLVVIEETEPLVERELHAAGIAVHGKDILPRTGELTADVVGPAIRKLLGEPEPAVPATAAKANVFPRPPTLCSACPHLGIYHALYAMRRRVIITGDIGCYTLGAGHPWNALDCCISMGASMGMALGVDKARGKADQKKAVVAVIGDSTFLHMGIQGLLNIIYNRGNVTALILDNRTTGMTGGQNHAGTGRDLHGEPAPSVDFVRLVEALGIKPERIRTVDTYEPETLFKVLREETAIPEPSVIITNRPCVLIGQFERQMPFQVIDDSCTGCSNCMDIGCPAISVRKRETETIDGEDFNLVFTTIDSMACTGCKICVAVCPSNAILPVGGAK